MAELMYRAGFTKGLEPVGGDPALGPLQYTQAHTLDELPTVGITPLDDHSGLLASVLRDFPEDDSDIPAGQKKDDCYVAEVVNPFPHNISYFKVRATFEGPHGAFDNADDYGWAMVVFARKGPVDYWPTRDERVTVTLQSGRKSGVSTLRMNTPGGAKPGTAYPYPSSSGQGPLLPEILRKVIFGSGDPADSEVPSKFTLELLIDRESDIARAGIECRINRDEFGSRSQFTDFTQRRWFIHHLLSGRIRSDPPSPLVQKMPIDTVGFALAVASGKGNATVKIRGFEIYRLNIIDIWVIRLGELLSRLLN